MILKDFDFILQICFQRECLQQQYSDITIVNEIERKRQRQESSSISFTGKPHVDNGLSFYESALVNGVSYEIGDFVMTRSCIDGTPHFVAQILYFVNDERGQDQAAHVRYFCRGIDTVLGNLGDEKELFALDDCEDVQVFEFVHKLKVNYWPVSENWFVQGGTEQAVTPAPNSESEFSYWFRMKYDHRYARFEAIDFDTEFEQILENTESGQCMLCQKNLLKVTEDQARLNEKLTSSSFVSLRIHNFDVYDGDCIFLNPNAYDMPYQKPRRNWESPKYTEYKNKTKDPKRYTEFWRFQRHSLKGTHTHTADPFRVAVVEGIETRSGNIFVKVRKLFRPEDTHMARPRKRDEGLQYNLDYVMKEDINKVYWSNEIVKVSANLIVGKCVLRPKAILRCTTDEWTRNGHCRFYFDQVYSAHDETMYPLSEEIIEKFSNETRYPVNEGALPTLQEPLKILDVFSGCGGLSVGLEQSGVGKSAWAIEKIPEAAEAFYKNHRESIVINEDCNHVLQLVMNGHLQNEAGQALPQKGEVDILAGGPPCQGFSGMNKFTEGEYSKFKNSLISSYLSFCDYYRPKFFILENVMGFANFKNSLIMKLCLRALVLMGYQCTFGILQAGNFGVPQSRRRCFIMAAAPGQKLPHYPEPLHVFSKQNKGLNVNVDLRAFLNDANWTDSAPYRATTCKEALADLPKIQSGSAVEYLKYQSKPETHFQKMVRFDKKRNQYLDWLNDHICRKMTPLNDMRIRLIPLVPGSDWRDLPNEVVQLGNGTWTEKLIPCNCKKSKKMDKSQCASLYNQNTMIPWGLSHNADTNNQWNGNFGRLLWNGFF